VCASGRLAYGDVNAADINHLHCRAVSVQSVTCSCVAVDSLLCCQKLQSCSKMPRSCIMRSEADWSDTSESDAESTATVLENTATGGQMMPVPAPATEPGPVGVPPETIPPPRTSG